MNDETKEAIRKVLLALEILAVDAHIECGGDGTYAKESIQWCFKHNPPMLDAYHHLKGLVTP